MIILSFCFFVVLGYLSGSLSSAIMLCRLFSLPDPRLGGSKNPGATNVLRLAGKKYAAMVLVGDLLKGFIPVLLAKLFIHDPIISGFTCLAAVLGHVYPIFFGFKGGKGVATALGGLLGMNLLLGLAALATWLLIAHYFRYSSLASLFTTALAPIYSIGAFRSQGAVTPLFLIFLVILYQHRENISRLVLGDEPKINLKGNSLRDEVESIIEEQEEEELLEAVEEASQEEIIIPGENSTTTTTTTPHKDEKDH